MARVVFGQKSDMPTFISKMVIYFFFIEYLVTLVVKNKGVFKKTMIGLNLCFLNTYYSTASSTIKL